MATTIGIITGASTQNAQNTTPRTVFEGSSLFNFKVRYLATKGVKTFIILEGKDYGLFGLDDTIVPKQIALTDMDAEEKKAWVEKIVTQIKAQAKVGDNVELHIGQPYVKLLMEPLTTAGFKVDVPCAGVGRIGHLMQWYKNNGGAAPAKPKKEKAPKAEKPKKEKPAKEAPAAEPADTEEAATEEATPAAVKVTKGKGKKA